MICLIRWLPLVCLLCSCTVDGPPCEHEPLEDCHCTTHYVPVCGCDDVTYDNSCLATCSGVKSYSKGPCIP